MWGFIIMLVRRPGCSSAPCRMVGIQLEEDYERRMTGEGLTYWVHKRMRVQFPECGADLAAGLLASKLQTYHIVGLGSQWETPPPPQQGILRNIGYYFRARQGCGNAQSRGARGGRNTDRATYALLAPSQWGHCDNCGGGKIPLPMLSPL